jgi:origin recognition complex subunit 6
LEDSRVLALVAVILFYVLSRMMDIDMTPELFLEWQERAISTLLKSNAGKECTEAEILTEIEKLMPMAQEEGWLHMEWFLNVLPVADAEQMEGVEITGTVASGKGKGLRDGGSDYIGLATMMQDATDYLGERQREDYKIWKASIMARIDGIEAS